MMPIEDIQERRSDGAWNVSFCALLMPAYKVAKVAGPGAFKRSGHFFDEGFLAKLRSCQFVTS